VAFKAGGVAQAFAAEGAAAAVVDAVHLNVDAFGVECADLAEHDAGCLSLVLAIEQFVAIVAAGLIWVVLHDVADAGFA